MAISSVGSIPLNQFPLGDKLSASARQKLSGDPVHEFLEYAQKSPAERLRASILKEMGLTEEELDQMDPETLKQVEKAIAERIKEKVEESQGPTGVFLDVTV